MSQNIVISDLENFEKVLKSSCEQDVAKPNETEENDNINEGIDDELELEVIEEENS